MIPSAVVAILVSMVLPSVNGGHNGILLVVADPCRNVSARVFGLGRESMILSLRLPPVGSLETALPLDLADSN